eukprot:scaffold489_cov259-Pinguiococcus_pyrenoidosus.AAC.5
MGRWSSLASGRWQASWLSAGPHPCAMERRVPWLCSIGQEGYTFSAACLRTNDRLVHGMGGRRDG